ncbi:ethanolamine ammonia-lyase subunit EutC [Acidipila sp. EB88]|nr:ethanolamine ammonia-lyase subunit EutC [Acidipila sp. EB88]
MRGGLPVPRVGKLPAPKLSPAGELSTVEPDPWEDLRRYTPARIALGRAGASLPTAEVLDFQMAHAQARDAVHLALDFAALAGALRQAGFATAAVESLAATRQEYVRRPDLGRRLHPDCRATLAPALGDATSAQRLTLVVADGLSSRAAATHALPLLCALRSRLIAHAARWSIDTIILASQARVALADEVGALRKAEAVVILLGERPGLSSPDSLGLYMTYRPRPGLTDADRNCISNVRAAGLGYAEAALKLHFLLDAARAAGVSGTSVKDHTDQSADSLSALPGSDACDADR